MRMTPTLTSRAARDRHLALLLRARKRLCALPLNEVSLTLRPLPIQAVMGGPPYVQGVSIIGGEAIPVVDLGCLLGESSPPATGRFVVVRAGPTRKVALAVEQIVAVTDLESANLGELPPLLSGAAQSTRSLAVADRELLVVLEAARLLPEDVGYRVAGAPR
jgi:purine-binding chemotaxis protein CheW